MRDPMYYLIPVDGGIDPEVRGPFRSDGERDAAALKIREHEQDENDVLFWLDVDPNGEPTIGAYSGGFFGEDLEED